jgi:ADP-Ribosyltransferase in polyvalent proteins/Phage MuF-C-terminal domain
MDIKEVKSRYPMLAGMDDVDAAKAFHQHFYPDFSEEEVAKRLGVDMRPKVPDASAPDEGRTVLGTAKDIGITALKGAMAVPEAAVGLLDIPTGGRVGKALEDVGLRFKDANAILDDSYSPAQKKANKAVADADGVGGKFVAALQNPSTIAHTIGQSVPSMLAGGVVGRGVAALAPRLGAVGAAAAGEGITAAGSAAEQIRQGTETGVMTAGQSGIAALSGAATGAFGLLGGKVAKSLGIADLDTAMVRASAEPAVAKSLVRRTLEGAISEGVLEELPQSISEQVLQNYALGKPLDEGVDQAAVMGLLSGAAMGGGMNALHGTPKEAPPAAPAAPDAPAVPLLGYAGTDPQAIQVDPQGNAATWQDRATGAPEGVRGFNDVTAVPPIPPGSPPPDAAAPLGLPAPTITVGSDGLARTAEDRNDRIQRIANGDVISEVGQPVPRPLGPLARAAAKAKPKDIIDVPAVVAPAQPQTTMFQEQASDALGTQPGAVDEHGVIDSPDNTNGIAGWSDEQLRAQLQSAQAPEVRRALYEEIGQREVATEQSSLQDELDAEQSAVANTQADDTAFAKLNVEDAADSPLPSDLLNAEGKPFTIRGAAARAGAKAGSGYEPVKIKGGWVARKLAAAASPGDGNGAQATQSQQTGSQSPKAAGAPGQAQGNTAAPRKGEIGMTLAAGEVVSTSSGRQTTAFPKVATDTNRKTLNTIKAADGWLMQNALDEARSRGDDFNARQFEASLTKPQQSDKDSAEHYLFGDQPAVVPSILKPLAAARPAADSVATTQDTDAGNLPAPTREDVRGPEAKVEDPKSAFPLKEASASYSGISHSGNRRAKADADEFQAYLDTARADGAEVAKSDAQKAAVEQAVDSLRSDYLKQYGRLMGVRAVTYSGFVAGRSGLNSNQAAKRNSAYDSAVDSFVSWQKANRARVRQAALDARTADEKAADRHAVVQANAEKAQRKEEVDRRLMRKVLAWKKGSEVVSFVKTANLAGVNLGRDGYPTSIKLVPTDGVALADDKFDLASLFRAKGMSVEDAKNRVRELVDAVRAEDLRSSDHPPAPTSPAAPAAPAAPATAPTQPSSKTPTLDAHVQLLAKVREGKASAEDFKAGFAAAEAGHDAMVAELGTMTKDQLLKSGGYTFASRYRSEKKGDIVAALARRVLEEYALGRSYGPSSYVMSVDGLAAHRKAMDAALAELVENTTDEDIKQHAQEIADARAEAAGRKAAAEQTLANPETLADFRAVMRHYIALGDNRQDAFLRLTPEQRARYDELEAASTKETREAAKAKLRTKVATAGQLTTGEVIETKHTKKGHDLFVVQLGERVSREDYDTLNASAKRMGGSYSSYRGNGAVPGFQFRTREAAEAFGKLVAGDAVDAQAVAEARRDAFQDDRSQTAVERLRAMAQALNERADESLSRDRKANTDRRARFAASAEAAARADQALAGTMENLAQAIEDGKAKFLDAVRQKVQVEFLASELRNAKDAQIRARYPTYAEQERHRGEPVDAETVDFSTYPSYTAMRSDLAAVGRQLLEVDGTKKLGARLMSVADDVSEAYTEWAKENLSQISRFGRAGELAEFRSKDDAERAIRRSGIADKAIVLPIKRGQNRVVLSPSEAARQGLWQGDGDKRITLSGEFGTELVEAVGRRANGKVRLPWALESAYEKRKRLGGMGVLTGSEYRAALREFAGIQEAPATPDKIKQMERAMIGRRADGLDFFPTSEAVVDSMLSVAGIEPGMTVLEPSAGMGHISDAIRAQSGMEPDVVELSGARRELLEAKGYNLVGSDFLEVTGKLYDRIVMNPPFSDGRDIQHVQHAFSLLKPGGRLVAIMGEGAFFHSNKRAEAFREWLSTMGATDEKLPAGSFMDPSLPVNTSVSARMVVVDKPAAADDGGVPFSRAPTEPKPTDFPAFKRWFGDSKVVDGEGKPMVVYHGSPEVFTEFSDEFSGEGDGNTDWGTGFYFASARAAAETYTQGSGNVMEVYLSIQNPAPRSVVERVMDQPGAEMDTEHVRDTLAKMGYDGIIIEHKGGEKEIVAFRPEQIKSATGNDGSFDPANPDIRFSRTGATQQQYEKRIDELFAGGKANTTGVRVLDSSDMLGLLGLGNGPVILAEGKVLAGQSKHPNMTAAEWKKIPEWLDNPAAVFDSDTVPGRLVLIAPDLVNGSPVRLIVQPNSTDSRAGTTVHVLVNAYDAGGQAPFLHWLRAGLGRFVDQRKFPAILGRLGLQLPNTVLQNKPGTKRILTEKQLGGYRKAQAAAAPDGPAMSRSQQEDGTSAEVKRVQSQVDAIKSRWSNAPEVVVAAHMQDDLIPERVRQADEAQRSAGAEGAPEGFFYKGKVYLVASELRTPKDVTRVLFHEALGHFGLRGVFGQDLASILNRVAVNRRAEVVAKAREYGLVGENVDPETATDNQVWQSMTQQQRQYAAEEVLAVMAQESPGQPWVQRAIAAIRTWLRENVPAFRQLRLTDAEIIRDYIVPARQFVAGGQKAGRQATIGPLRTAEAPMYSRAPSVMRDMRSQVRDSLNSRFAHPGTLSWWHKTIGTMYNLAEQSPAFKKVYQSAQAYIDDISQYALDAADRAPNLIPRLEDWRDAVPGLSKKQPISTEDAGAIAAPIFEGTLNWVRDLSGKPVRVEDAVKEAQGLGVEQKVSRMMKAGTIDPGMLNAWRALPISQYEKNVASRFESQHLTGGVVWSDAELRSLFKLNDRQVGLYKEYRTAIDRSLDTTTRSDIVRIGGALLAPVRDIIMDAANIGDAMMAIDSFVKQEVAADPGKANAYADVLQGVKRGADRLADLQARGYAPLQRFGEFTVHVAGEKEGDASRYFGMFETKQEANAMAAKLRKEFGDSVVQGTLSKEEHKLLAGITPESLEIFGDMLGLAGAENGTDHVYQEFLRKAKSDQSALKRMIHRQGIAGFSEDVGRGLASFIYSNARMTSGGLHIGDIGKAVADIPKNQGQMRDAAERLRQHVLEPQEKGAGIRAFMFAQYLGGSLASAAVNLTQPLTTSLPYLSRFGGAAKAGQALVQASIDMASGGKAYGPELSAALERAEKAGVVSPQEIHYLMGQARGSGSLRSGDGTKAGQVNAMRHNAWQRTKLLWGTAFGWAEQVNRRMTFVAAYRMAKENKFDNPYAFAAKAVDETQFVQNKANKMEWGRGAVGGTLMTFKGFSIAYLELMYRMWNAGEAGSRERADGRKAVMIALGTLMLFGGGGGVPFLEDAEDVATGFGQMLGFNWNAKKARQDFLERTFGRELAQFLDKGLSGVPGVPIDVSGRLGMGNLIPGTGLLQEKTSYTRDYMELLGPAGDFVSRVAEGGKQVLGGAVTWDASKVMRGAMQMAPKAVSNLEKGVDMGASGTYKDTRGGKVSDVTPTEAIMKAIGFQPSSVAEIQEGNYLRQQAKNFYNMKSQEIRALWAKGIAEKDQDIIARARAALKDWNTKNPDQPMVANLPAIIKKAKEMQRDKADRIAATAPKAMRTQMKREIQEAKGELLH